MGRGQDYKNLSDDELLAKQWEAADHVALARAWANEPDVAHAGIAGSNWPFVDAMAEVCRISLQWMLNGHEYDEERSNAAIQVIDLARACRRHASNGDAAKAANTAANAAATYYSFGLNAFAEEMKRKAEALEPSARTGKKVRAGASKGGKEKAIWPKRAQELQRAGESAHKKNPRLSYNTIKNRVTADFGCSPTTIKRYTTNPTKK